MVKQPSNGALEQNTRESKKKAVDSGKVVEEIPQDRRSSLLRLLNNLPSLVYRCRNDKDWTMEFVTDGCIELTGYQPSDLIKNRKVAYAELIHPQDRDHVWKEVQAAVREKSGFRIVYRITTASGEQKWVEGLGKGIFSQDGNLTALEGFVADISEYKGTLEKIERLNLVLRAIRNVNQLLVKEKDRGRLIQGVCDNLPMQ